MDSNNISDPDIKQIHKFIKWMCKIFHEIGSPQVCQIDTLARYVTVVSLPEQLHTYMENPQPHIRAVKWLYIYI